MIEDLNELKECLKSCQAIWKKKHFVGTCAEIAINEKSNRRKIFKLMGDVTKDKVLSEAQIANGLAPIFEILDDVMIDSPLAGKWIGEIIGNCITSGGIDKASFVQKCFSKINNERHQAKVQQGIDQELRKNRKGGV